MLVTTKLCVTTTPCLLWQNFCCNKYLSQQKCCCDKHTFVTTNMSFVTTKVCLLQQKFCHDKHTFVTKTKVLSRQAHFCHEKRCVPLVFVITSGVHGSSPTETTYPVTYNWRELPQVSFLSWQNTSFVTTNIILSWQKFCRNKHTFVATNVSRQNMSFVATKLVTKDAFCCDRFCHNKHTCCDRNYTCGSSCQWW